MEDKRYCRDCNKETEHEKMSWGDYIEWVCVPCKNEYIRNYRDKNKLPLDEIK